MARRHQRVPWEPPESFWEALQAPWLTHMLVMSDEKYPGSGVSFGQLITLAGMGPDGTDLACDRTYAMLEMIDE
jgi:pyruvate-formate lyase